MTNSNNRSFGKRIHVFIRDTSDVDWARQTVRELSGHEGLTQTRAAALATAVTEIARNIVVHAGRGEMSFCPVHEGQRRHGILVEARDEGPGIADLARAMEDGYSTKDSLGLGLSGAKRLVDEFEIKSVAGSGVVVNMTQWSDDDMRDDLFSQEIDKLA